ncbi:MAG: B12-binding domain-containing radical SAM protein [Candidatus Kryptoniota bacterium]
MTDVLLSHSYFLRFDRKQFKTMQPYAPLSTLYAASVLREAGISVVLFDSMFASREEELSMMIRKYSPKIVAICDDNFNYLTKMCLERMRLATYRMIEIARQARCTVIVSALDSSDRFSEYLYHGAQFVIYGEPEYTLLELCEDILSKDSRDVGSINGVIFKSEGKVIIAPPRAPTSNLDLIPFPAWDLVDIERYRIAWQNRHRYFSMNLVTTRGCPFGCNWCAKPVYGRSYNSRSPENVMEEIAIIVDRYHPDHIWFCDDIFGLKSGWIRQFSEEVAKTNIRIRYKCLSRPDLLLKENSFQLLAASGCETVWIGAESGSQKILDAMEKGTRVEQIRLATRKLRKEGIRVGYFLQFGYPGETYEEIRKTFRMVLDEMPDEIGVSVSYPLPGTEFYEMVRRNLGAKKNWYDSSDISLLFPGEFKPIFYRVLHSFLHKIHRMRRITLRMEKLTLRSIFIYLVNLVSLPWLFLVMQLLRIRNPETES